jgi:hypothetical protein
MVKNGTQRDGSRLSSLSPAHAWQARFRVFPTAPGPRYSADMYCRTHTLSISTGEYMCCPVRVVAVMKDIRIAQIFGRIISRSVGTDKYLSLKLRFERFGTKQNIHLQ